MSVNSVAETAQSRLTRAPWPLENTTKRGGRGIGGRREDGGEKTSKIRGRALSPRRRGTLPIGFLFFSSSSSSFLKRLYVES